MTSNRRRLLILGGSAEGRALAEILTTCTEIAPTLSLAGRTEHPVAPPIPFRIGGFGGVEGLLSYLREQRIDAVVDATHPFAARISAHARAAAAEARVPLAVFTRPGWGAVVGDDWRKVASIADAPAALGDRPRRVFLTTGRLDLAVFRAAPQHHYLVRTIDLPDPADLPPDHRLILGRGPFRAADEAKLMQAERIDVLVTKDSGAAATAAKLGAARDLGLPVIMIERPRDAGQLVFYAMSDVMQWVRGVALASVSKQLSPSR